MHTLSKLRVCLIVLCGRHCGLTAALDRMVLLHFEFLATLSRQCSMIGEKKDAAKVGPEPINVPEVCQPPTLLDP